MKLWVVTKSPVDLPGAQEFIGAFTTPKMANDAVQGAGIYTIAEMDADRRYKGDLRNVQILHKLDHRQT